MDDMKNALATTAATEDDVKKYLLFYASSYVWF